jgi:hypothetical protein
MRLIPYFDLHLLFHKIENTKNGTRDQLENKVRCMIPLFTKYNWQLDSIYNRLGITDSKINAMESSYP